MLTNSITTDERAVSILAIVGMGGLGKTTLTRKVFNHEMVKPRFGSRIWVHVSPNFDALTLFKKILKELTHQVEGESKQAILSKLKQSLKDKTYLLVLDDVWNENLLEWEDFISSLLGVSSVKGNAIVITTRSMKVASIVNPLHTHELEGLSVEHCWSIIKEKTFEKKNVPSKFEVIGRKIAGRCQGLPLAANVVGGLLRNQSEEKWCSIEEKWLSADEGGDDISKILRLSFDNLSLPSLKKCFAYCAMFPKGYWIVKQKLIEMWMAEGFLQADGRDDMESVGEKFVNVLLHNSLLQVSERDYYGNVESCDMHDLVHDLACSVSSSSNSTGGSSRVRYKISSRIPKEMSKSLRTLLITSKGHISDFDFSDFESLHVLRLVDNGVEELSSSIQKLTHLRYFDLSWTKIEYLPDWIGEFFHLQTLRVESRYLKKLPCTIKYLINLRHLYTHYDVELPMGIGRLTCLQTLNYFPVGDENGCKIEELGSLNNLSGYLGIRNLESIHDKEEAGKANLFRKSKISKLYLKWDGDVEWDEYREYETNDEDVLEGLQPHSNLMELEIDRFNGKRLPSWTQKMAVRDAPQGSWVVLNKLMSLLLIDCKRCEDLPMLGQLPNLKTLELNGLSNLECINSSFYGMVNKNTRIAFPALEKLVLERMCELTEIEIPDGSEVKVFPRLKHLEIKHCKRLKSVPTDWLFSNNQTLSYLNIEDCPNLREISDSGGQESQGRSFTSLHWLEIIECNALEYLPCEMLGFSLKYLSLERLSSLKNLPRVIDCLPKLPRLKELTIEGVPKFMATGCLEISPFPSLRNISIDVSMGGSMEAVDAILQGCCHSLYNLRLKGMDSWECLPESIQHLTSLSVLWLEDFGMEELSEWFGNLSSLKELYLYNCKRLRRLPSMDAMRRLTSLYPPNHH